MNKQETAKVIAYLREMYPQGASPTQATVNAWADLFADVPYEVAWSAAREVCRTWNGYAMPPAAALFKVIEQAQADNKTAIEKWRVVEKLIKRGTRLTQSEFDEQDEDIKAYFGGVSAIRDLALLNQDEIPNERARFLKAMPAIKERIETQNRLPQSVQNMLGQITKQIGG